MSFSLTNNCNFVINNQHFTVDVDNFSYWFVVKFPFLPQSTETYIFSPFASTDCKYLIGFLKVENKILTYFFLFIYNLEFLLFKLLF